MKDLGMMHYILGMEVWTREVCSRDPEEVQDDGMQVHEHVANLHTPRSRGRNLQATRCVLGGKYRVKAVTLFLTPPFRLNS